MSYQNQLCPVQIPDVVPTNLPTYGLFSMAAGDFLEVYIEKGLIHVRLVAVVFDDNGIVLWVKTSVIRHYTISTRAREMGTTSTTVIFVLFQ